MGGGEREKRFRDGETQDTRLEQAKSEGGRTDYYKYGTGGGGGGGGGGGATAH